MGQAKRRGTFDQRKQSAEGALELARKTELERQRAVEAALTPEGRARRDAIRNKITMMVGIGIGASRF